MNMLLFFDKNADARFILIEAGTITNKDLGRIVDNLKNTLARCKFREEQLSKRCI